MVDPDVNKEGAGECIPPVIEQNENKTDESSLVYKISLKQLSIHMVQHFSLDNLRMRLGSRCRRMQMDSPISRLAKLPARTKRRLSETSTSKPTHDLSTVHR